MSNVKWCDIGQHAFPENQPGSTTIFVDQKVRNQWGGVQSDKVGQDACAACAVDTGIKQMGDTLVQTDDEYLATARMIRDSPGAAVKRIQAGIKGALGNGGSKPPPVADKDHYLVDREEYDKYIADLEKKNLASADLTDQSPYL